MLALSGMMKKETWPCHYPPMSCVPMPHPHPLLLPLLLGWGLLLRLPLPQHQVALHPHLPHPYLVDQG